MSDPQTNREAVQLLRADLRCVADRLEMLLDNGFPKKGRSMDDIESFEQWHEDIHESVGNARLALEKTSIFSDPEGPTNEEIIKTVRKAGIEDVLITDCLRIAHAVLARWGADD
jgi:hypothetical protein